MKEQQNKAKEITNLLQILNLYLTEKSNVDFTDELYPFEPKLHVSSHCLPLLDSLSLKTRV
jgi:hypothetical protein